MSSKIYLYLQDYLPKEVEYLSFLRNQDGSWNVYVDNRPSADYNLREECAEGMKMDSNGVRGFIREVRSIFGYRPTDQVELSVRFIENKPKLKLSMCHVLPGSEFYTKKDHGKFALDISLNYLARMDGPTRREDEYKYEDGGVEFGPTRFFDQSYLEEFLVRLEKELVVE